MSSPQARNAERPFENAVEVNVTPQELTFRLEGDDSRVVPWSALTEIRIRTTAGGVDLLWELRAAGPDAMVSMASGPSDNELMDGFAKRLRGVDLAMMSAAMASTTEASYLIWTRSAAA